MGFISVILISPIIVPHKYELLCDRQFLECLLVLVFVIVIIIYDNKRYVCFYAFIFDLLVAQI